jgi:hypothetical protein
MASLRGRHGTPRTLSRQWVSTAEEMVRWYTRALKGEFFRKPETLLEFKRIQAMADSLWHVVPADTLAYGKGGSIDWQDFHCFALPGQMLVRGVPVTFCFTINWTGPADGVASTFEAYKNAVADALNEAKKIPSPSKKVSAMPRGAGGEGACRGWRSRSPVALNRVGPGIARSSHTSRKESCATYEEWLS